MNIKVVIGANFGDEGKGLMTDYFASKAENGVIVRFNGGCQAGHTVMTPDGKRHVFGHVGSGAFAGLPTYLSKHFIVNPIIFNKEYGHLFYHKKGGLNLPLVNSVHVHSECIVTTVYDMLINQAMETIRRKNRHGSCGLGINETVERSLRPEYRILVSDSVEEMERKLRLIQLNYVPERLNQLGVWDRIPETFESLFVDKDIMEAFVEDFKAMKAKLNIVDDQESFLNRFQDVIFEGAQGLLLDQEHEYFPNVTRSNTGIKNVVEVLKDSNLQEHPVEIVYATRCYLTRHGAGPFPTETEDKPYPKITDLTNIPNEFQGTLRFGLLDINYIAKTIRNDLKFVEGFNFMEKLAVTCLDQMEGKATFVHNNDVLNATEDDFLEALFHEVGVNYGYLSYGPTRSDIQIYHPTFKAKGDLYENC